MPCSSIWLGRFAALQAGLVDLIGDVKGIEIGQSMETNQEVLLRIARNQESSSSEPPSNDKDNLSAQMPHPTVSTHDNSSQWGVVGVLLRHPDEVFGGEFHSPGGIISKKGWRGSEEAQPIGCLTSLKQLSLIFQIARNRSRRGQGVLLYDRPGGSGAESQMFDCGSCVYAHVLPVLASAFPLSLHGFLQKLCLFLESRDERWS